MIPRNFFMRIFGDSVKKAVEEKRGSLHKKRDQHTGDPLKEIDKTGVWARRGKSKACAGEKRT